MTNSFKDFFCGRPDLFRGALNPKKGNKMTRAEAISKAFSEATGKPVEFFMDLIEIAKKRPGGHIFDEQIPEESAEKLISIAKNDPASVWAWLIKGAISSMNETGHC